MRVVLTALSWILRRRNSCAQARISRPNRLALLDNPES